MFHKLIAAFFIFSAALCSGAEDLSPYLIPEDHPIKEALDRLFSSRVSASSEEMRKAGFKNPEPRKYSGAIVTTHPDMPGYYIKAYTDDQEDVSDIQRLGSRVAGAFRIRGIIEKNGLGKIFKVPQKWLYPLPYSENGKSFILVAEDMELLHYSKNLKIWRQPHFPKNTLLALHLLLEEGGLKDSVFAFNLPFAKDGRIAIVDTEYTLQWPVPYDCLLQFLSPENRVFWKTITSL